MDRWGIPVTGLLLFCALCAYSAYSEPRAIEEDLMARSLAALHAAGIEVPPQGLRLDGQTAILSGPAGSPIVGEEARLRVEAVWGVAEVLVQPAGGTPTPKPVASQLQPLPVPATPKQPATTQPVASSTPAATAGTADAVGTLETQLQQFLTGKAIRFVPNRDVLMSDARQVLSGLASLLKAAPSGIAVRIEGHTDSDGDAQKNVNLSKRRAAAVKRYLVSRGISANRLSSDGFGATKPIADNSTEDGKIRNRRIEIHATASSGGQQD
jgi:outer membrane protein OmpA-like peptidoglycan-associated protein